MTDDQQGTPIVNFDEKVIRTLIVDDQELVRLGLELVLESEPGILVVGQCADGDEVVAAVDRQAPDVVIMDLRMPRMDGIAATRALVARGSPPILALTTFNDDDLLSAALRSGAAGFVLKDSPAEDLIRAVLAVGRGGGYLDPAVTTRVLAQYRSSRSPSRPDAVAQLTVRELEVLGLIARGRNNAEISAALCISELTVKTHVGHIFTKLELRDRAAAIVFAYEHRLVPVD